MAIISAEKYISNLENELQQARKLLGEAHDGLIAKSYSLCHPLVENIEDFLRQSADQEEK